MKEEVKQRDTTKKGMEYEPMLVAGLTMEAYLKKETAPITIRFWAEDYEVTPYLCGTIIGDGLQLVYISSIDMRPYYWLLRIDSNTNVNEDDFDYENEILEHVEEECGGCNCEDMCDCEYPIMKWGGGSWGMVANFKTGQEGS